MKSGILYVVPTPVGNLKDITQRALETLQEVDEILAEDTRTTGKLLKLYEISRPLQSFHAYNEHQSIERIVAKLEGGARMALVSDAGTPGISDPGFLLTRACAEAGIEVQTLPGATAFVPALVNSGLPCDRFVFEGFLPHKKGRQKRIKALTEEERTMVFYESPYRTAKLLAQLAEFLGEDRAASVSREISKIYEETRRGSLVELSRHFTDHPPKGEIVVVVAGKAL